MAGTPPGEERPLRSFSFLIAGTQKSGTTSLSKLLDQHRHIQRAPLKEMHYFDNEQRDWASGDFSDFRVPPRGPLPKIVGDATPLYLWWPQALDRIRAYNPDMKFIAIFRDPIDRLFSQWQMVVNRWPELAPDWPRFLTRFAPDGLEDRIPEGVDDVEFRMESGVVRGYYGAQLERGYSMFGEDQFHVLEFGAFLKDHTTALDQITDFLELPRYPQYPPLPHFMPGRPGVPGTAPTREDIASLAERWREDFASFKTLSGLDVSHWSLQRILDGDLDPGELAAKYARKVVPPGGRPGSGGPVQDGPVQDG